MDKRFSTVSSVGSVYSQGEPSSHGHRDQHQTIPEHLEEEDEDEAIWQRYGVMSSARAVSSVKIRTETTTGGGDGERKAGPVSSNASNRSSQDLSSSGYPAYPTRSSAYKLDSMSPSFPGDWSSELTYQSEGPAKTDLRQVSEKLDGASEQWDDKDYAASDIGLTEDGAQHRPRAERRKRLVIFSVLGTIGEEPRVHREYPITQLNSYVTALILITVVGVVVSKRKNAEQGTTTSEHSPAGVSESLGQAASRRVSSIAPSSGSPSSASAMATASGSAQQQAVTSYAALVVSGSTTWVAQVPSSSGQTWPAGTTAMPWQPQGSSASGGGQQQSQGAGWQQQQQATAPSASSWANSGNGAGGQWQPSPSANAWQTASAAIGNSNDGSGGRGNNNGNAVQGGNEQSWRAPSSSAGQLQPSSDAGQQSQQPSNAAGGQQTQEVQSTPAAVVQQVLSLRPPMTGE